jgi:replicative superfamily II helicase
MEKMRWIDHVRNEEVLHRVKVERNILHTIKRRKIDWIGHILCRNCLLKHVVEGKIEGRIEVTIRQGRRRKQLLDDLKETRGY